MIKWESGEIVKDKYIDSGMYVEVGSQKLPVMMPKIEGDTPLTAENLNKIVEGIAPDEYDDTAIYEVDDYCIYNNVLYKCITAVTVAEAFDNTKWQQTQVTTELKKLQTHKTTVQIAQFTITASSADYTTNSIDFSLYDKVIVQFAHPNEGDTIIFEIDEAGSPINDVCHYSDFATNDYQSQGFVYINRANNTITIHKQTLSGWDGIVARVIGVTK